MTWTTDIPVPAWILVLAIGWLFVGSIPWVERRWRRMGLYAANRIADWAESEGPL